MKRQSLEWEKITANETTDKELIFKIYKHLIQKNKQLNQKLGGRPKQTFLQKDIDGQQANKRMLNTAHYQKSVNKNYNEVLAHISQNGHHQKIYKQ